MKPTKLNLFLLLIALSVAFTCHLKPKNPTNKQKIEALYQKDTPTNEPESPLWQAAAPLQVKLLRQNATSPQLTESSVPAVEVRALYNEAWVVFRLSWEDESRDVISGPSLFSDAAAVQLPAKAGAPPNPTMGEPGKEVKIVYWKAVWQEKDNVAALRPNMAYDGYPNEAAKDPQDKEALAKALSHAAAAQNPSLAHSFTQMLTASGFSALEVDAEQSSAGRGLWRDGRWYTTLAFPREQLEVLAQSNKTFAAFAVWDGSKDNVGAKKMRSVWVELLLLPR